MVDVICTLAAISIVALILAGLVSAVLCVWWCAINLVESWLTPEEE